MTKFFDYRTVATIVSDLLFDDLDKVNELVSYMTGQDVTCRNAKALARVCRGYFMTRYPALQTLNFKSCSPIVYDCYVADLNDSVGAYVAVEPHVAALRPAH